MTGPVEISKQDVAKVAASAGCDSRTVVRALQGRTQSHVMRAAIGKALREFGFNREAKLLEEKKA